MPCARNYSLNDVNDILQQSEGRLSPVSNQPGHALQLHVDARGEQLSDRFMRKATSSVGRAFVVGEHGEIADENDTVTSWKGYDQHHKRPQSMKAIKRDLGAQISRLPSASGAFADRQAAIIVARHVLNSPYGQQQLALLDSAAGTSNRVNIRMDVPLTVHNGQPATMYLSDGNNDVPHLENVNAAFLLVDLLAPGQIHVQTFYPIN